MTQQLDLDDIQGLVARGYGTLTAACYAPLEIVQPDAAARWLSALAGDVTTADRRPEGQALNIAVTSAGLAKLGVSPDTLALFSNAFVDGMTTPHRRRLLGDVEENAPDGWLWGGPGTAPVDLLLLVFASDQPTLKAYYARLAAQFAAGGVREIVLLETSDLDGVEHFGFRDGVSQPFIEGLGHPGPPAQTVSAGEFVLGYENEYGKYTGRPLLDRAADPKGLLPRDTAGSGQPDLGRNGTYLVYRQLRQDVRGFWRFVDAATRNADGSPNPTARMHLAAKMVGRWPSGAPLALAPDQDDPSFADENAFRYHDTDVDGLHCPIGAHIRRANPRDSLDPNPGTESSLAVNRRHRLLRRGREYGPPLSLEEITFDAEPPRVASAPLSATQGGRHRASMPGDIGDADAAQHALQTERAMRHAAMAAGGPDVPREMRPARAPAPAEPGEPGDAGEPERGLHFICLNANISRQFEFVQSTWINDPKFDGLYSDPDPLVAPHRTDGATGSPTFTVPAQPVRQRVTDLPQFVTMRGGGYFFLPGIRALRYLSTLASRG